MAREWSRRSIEEIARKIGKGLGGIVYDISSGCYGDGFGNPNCILKYNSLPNSVEGFQYDYDNHYPRIENIPIEASTKPSSLTSNTKVLLGTIPYININAEGKPSGYETVVKTNTSSPALPFAKLDSSIYDVIFYSYNGVTELITNLSTHYAAGEISLDFAYMNAVEDAFSAGKYDTYIKYSDKSVQYLGIIIEGSELSNIWDNISALDTGSGVDTILTIQEKV